MRGAMTVLVFASGCTLVFGPGPGEDDPSSGQCTEATVLEDCGADAICHCGLCAESNEQCRGSLLSYSDDTPRAGACVGSPEKLVAGRRHTCLLRTDGTVYCWGAHVDGQLGTTDPEPGSDAFSAAPVAVRVADGTRLEDATDVAAGMLHTCVVRGEDRELWCWGENLEGQLGRGETSEEATPVPAPVRVDGDTGAPLAGIEEVALGDRHSCALDDENVLRCWGLRKSGQTGTEVSVVPTTRPEVVPDPDVATIGTYQTVAAGGRHTCAGFGEDANSDELYCWGRAAEGQLGIGDPGDCDMGECKIAEPSPVPGLGLPPFEPVHIAGASQSTCATQDQGRDLYCWGTSMPDDEEPLTQDEPLDVDTYSFIERIALGSDLLAFVQDDGSVYLMGSDMFGQQGNGDEIGDYVTDPTELPDIAAIDIAAGWEHACVITEGRQVLCWGNNDSGQLGDGSMATRHQPSAVDLSPMCP